MRAGLTPLPKAWLPALERLASVINDGSHELPNALAGAIRSATLARAALGSDIAPHAAECLRHLIELRRIVNGLRSSQATADERQGGPA